MPLTELVGKGLVAGQTLFGKAETLAKERMNSGHSSPFDYGIAWGPDAQFTGLPVCKWSDTGCPYGSGNEYTAQKEVFLGPPGSGGRDLILRGHPVVVCYLKREQ